MTLNRELFVEDPTKMNIPNLGVAKVKEPKDANDWKVLRYELSSFVCDGEYERGLDKILTSYVNQVGDEQPAVWVSGFYGSGKSHLVRVLEALWRDTELPDGARARGLAKVSPTIAGQLRELTTLGRRKGGLFAASGELGTGAGDVRLSFMSVVLKAAGLPESLPQARCMLWMMQEEAPSGGSLLDSVRAEIDRRGLDWHMLLANMYVSELAEVILSVHPAWATGPDVGKELLVSQYPPVATVSLDDTMTVLEQVLRLSSDDPATLPCTLIVLDEMQAFINDDPDRTEQVRMLVEHCTQRFDGLVLIVATGQSALNTTAVLQKLMDRFLVEVQLSDQDVETVIRQVVLRKKPEQVSALEARLEQISGEISKELAGARIAHGPDDQDDLVPDYPLLPSRRRFWESVLKAVDKGGKAGQLRTQLKVVHEATKAVAERSVGTVVPADFVFDVQATGMLTSGVLLRETKQLIEAERTNGSDGELRARALATAFLIAQLPREGFADTGVRATAAHIADLLVADLSSDGETLRREVPKVLAALEQEAKLQLVGEEYLLRTRDSQEWNKDFVGRSSGIKNDPARLQALRDEALRAAITGAIPKQVAHGKSKVSRTVTTHFSDVRPPLDSSIPVWIRPGWEITEKQARDAAAAEGVESPLIMVFLPKHEPDALAGALVEAAAAQETLDTRAKPTTDEGRDAAKAMESTRDAARAKIDQLIQAILHRAVVLQGGGAEASGSDLKSTVTSAVDKALVRLFPKFGDADRTGWDTVVKRVQEGNADPLGAIGYSGEAKEQPVCKTVLDAIPHGGVSGADIRARFEAPRYGWPLDAIRAALFALLASGDVSAEENGSPVTGKTVVPTKVGKYVFRPEKDKISAADRVAVRGLLKEAGIPCEANEEVAGCVALKQRLVDFAAAAGGPPPLPAPPKADVVDELQALKGNELIAAVLARTDVIRARVIAWKAAAELAVGRREVYEKARRLSTHLPTSSNAEELTYRLAAIEKERLLLQQPDPCAPLVGEMADLIRLALRERLDAYAEALSAGMDDLDADDNWGRLDDSKRGELLSQYGLRPEIDPDLGTPEKVLAAVQSRPLSAWNDRIDAVPAKVAQAREAAAKLLEPKAVKVSVPSATIGSTDDIESYVTQLKQLLATKLDEHGSIII